MGWLYESMINIYEHTTELNLAVSINILVQKPTGRFAEYLGLLRFVVLVRLPCPDVVHRPCPRR